MSCQSMTCPMPKFLKDLASQLEHSMHHKKGPCFLKVWSAYSWTSMSCQSVTFPMLQAWKDLANQSECSMHCQKSPLFY